MLSQLRCACIATIWFAASAQAQAPGGEVLEPRAYVQAVLRVNPGIEAARHGWRAAQARTRQAGAFDDPMIEASFAPLSAATSEFGYEVGIRQALPWFGTRALERAVMKAEAAAAANDLESTRRELAMAAIELYARYYVVLRSLEINASHLTLVQSVRDATAARLEGGRGALEDALQADVELATLERAALELAADRDVVVAQMNELLHRDPGSPLPPPARSLAIRRQDRTVDAKRLAAEAVRARPQIAAARQRARAETLRAAVAERAYFPTISVATSYSTMWHMPEHRWMVGFGLNVPWPTDRRSGAVDEARAAHAEYESEIARLSAAARTEVFVALRKLEESEQVLGLFETRLLPVARRRAGAAHASFTALQGSYVSVIEAQKTLRSLELEHELVQAEHVRRSAELERVLGRIPGLESEGGAP